MKKVMHDRTASSAEKARRHESGISRYIAIHYAEQSGILPTNARQMLIDELKAYIC